MAKKIKDHLGRDTGRFEPGIIYELGYESDGKWIPFYVGESYKKEQRLNQHKSLVKNGDTSLHVYDYIRHELEPKNIEWTLSVVLEYGEEGPTDLEDEQIVKRLVEQYELKNKKKGSENWRLERDLAAAEMRRRGLTSYRKYRAQLDYEREERKIQEQNELRRQQELKTQEQNARELRRQAIIAETLRQAEENRKREELVREQERIKKKQQEERWQAEQPERERRLREETQRLANENWLVNKRHGCNDSNRNSKKNNGGRNNNDFVKKGNDSKNDWHLRQQENMPK